jgi:hypothetical protein
MLSVTVLTEDLVGKLRPIMVGKGIDDDGNAIPVEDLIRSLASAIAVAVDTYVRTATVVTATVFPQVPPTPLAGTGFLT